MYTINQQRTGIKTELRDLRLRRGLSQKQLAVKLGVSHNTVSSWELHGKVSRIQTTDIVTFYGFKTISEFEKRIELVIEHHLASPQFTKKKNIQETQLISIKSRTDKNSIKS